MITFKIYLLENDCYADRRCILLFVIYEEFHLRKVKSGRPGLAFSIKRTPTVLELHTRTGLDWSLSLPPKNLEALYVLNIPTLEMASKVFLVVFILATTLLLQSEAFHVGTAGDLRLGKKRDSLPGRIQVK